MRRVLTFWDALGIFGCGMVSGFAIAMCIANGNAEFFETLATWRWL